MKMKKFINEPENLTEELLEGLALANPEMLKIEDNHLVVNRKLETADRVTIVTMGGSGHEPCCSGFVGEGMIDISVIGDIFAAPGPQACAEALRRADRGKGVVYIVLNHAGDMLSGNMAMKMIRQDDIRVPLRYNNDTQKNPLFSRGLSVCRLLFNSFSKLKIDENYKEKRRLFY